MSSTDTDVRSKKSASRDSEELTDQIDAIRADIQSLKHLGLNVLTMDTYGTPSDFRSVQHHIVCLG